MIKLIQLLPTEPDLTSLQTLSASCHEYLSQQEGKPVDAAFAAEFFKYRPGDCPPENKIVLGIYYKELLIGVFELFVHYPSTDTLNLGLMVIDPAFRGQGFGQMAYHLLDAWTLVRNMTTIRLGVLLWNNDGLRFWEKLGFRKTGEIKQYLQHQFYVLQKSRQII
ncbi:MAG: acetyltransferase [Firmicutes bacterium]|nr:acetyltransferase [Bacillota bacterium]